MAALGYGLARCLPDFQHHFISQARAQEVTEEQAIQEFHRLMLRETRGRTGVLLLVSLLERRVVVLADEGIDSRVKEGTWEGVQQAIQGQVAQGNLVSGLVQGVAAAGEILAEHFPGDGHSEGLPNLVQVRRE
jgi:putative membrane protein